MMKYLANYLSIFSWFLNIKNLSLIGVFFLPKQNSFWSPSSCFTKVIQYSWGKLLLSPENLNGENETVFCFVTQTILRQKILWNNKGDFCSSVRLPEWTFARVDICLSRDLPECLFVLIDIYSSRHLLEWTFAQINNCPKGLLPEWTLTQVEVCPIGLSLKQTSCPYHCPSECFDNEWGIQFYQNT